MAGRAFIVFRSDTLLAKADFGRNSALCFVVFDPMVEDHSLDRVAFAERFLAEYGYDAIHVLSSCNGWYQDPDLPAALEAIRSLTRHYERVVVYGSSMGGYAALRFAAAVGAHSVIAISPQYSMLPSAAPFEHRWKKLRKNVRWLHERPGDHIGHVEDAIVFYDDSGPDRLHAEAIRRHLPHVTAVALTYAGHPVSTVLVDIGAMTRSVIDAAHGRFDCGPLFAALRRHRHRSGQFLITLARRQPMWRLRLKARLAERACEVAPSQRDLLSYVGLAQECLGHRERALAFHVAASRLPGRPSGVDLRMARALWRAGRKREARKVFERTRLSMWDIEPLHDVGARLPSVQGAFHEGKIVNRSVLARALGRLAWTRILYNRLLPILARWFALAEMLYSVWLPTDSRVELSEADKQ